MKKLAKLPLTDDLSGAWFNSNLVITSVIEAVSFVTPVLESFLIKAVSDGLPLVGGKAFADSCQEFMREESNHSRAHRRLNLHLQSYLGKEPCGLAMVKGLMEAARARLSVSSRLALASALEHFTAVFSRAYRAQEQGMVFNCDFARELFSRHAEEEIAHRATVFNLWRAVSNCSFLKRLLALAAVLAVGCAYMCCAVPWILYRKTGRRIGKTCSAVASGGYRKYIAATRLLSEIFSYARSDYHPDMLSEDKAFPQR